MALAACGAARGQETTTAPQRESAGEFPKTIVQSDGQSLRLERRPQRIASVTLGTDEILLDLVEPARIVALSIFADDPQNSNVVEKAKAVKARVAGYAEQVLALAPDLIFVASYSKPEFLRLLQGAGLPVFKFQTFETIDQILANVETVGQAVGETEKAKALTAQARRRIEAVAKAVAGKPRPSVLSFSYGWVAGRRTTVHDIIGAAGGRNYAADQGIEGSREVPTEILLTWRPDYLLVLGPGNRRGAAQAAVEQRPALSALDAVREGRVLMMRSSRLSPVSHYVAQGVEDLARLLHPDCFKTAEGNDTGPGGSG